MEETTGRSYPRASILIADDIAAWRAQVRSILRQRPEWQVICDACDGIQAVEKTGELRPEIVLLDIGMPLLNGIEAGKRIRQDAPASRIIFLTQENDEDVRMAALSTGAEAYLVKANAARELVPTIDAALQNGHRND